MRFTAAALALAVLCFAGVSLTYDEKNPVEALVSEQGGGSDGSDAVLASDRGDGRVDAVEARGSQLQSSVSDAEDMYLSRSPTFDVRHGTFGYPSPVRDTAAIVECPVFNPDRVQLNEEEFNELSAIIEAANERLKTLQGRSGSLLVDWSREKVVTFGEGQDLTGDVVRPARHEDCFVGTYTSADPDVPDQLVVIYPNEFPVLDSAFNDCWLELDLTHDQIAAFFTDLRN